MEQNNDDNKTNNASTTCTIMIIYNNKIYEILILCVLYNNLTCASVDVPILNGRSWI